MNDNLGGGFEAFLYDACVNILSVTKGAVYVCMSSSELDTLQRAFRAAGGRWSTFVIWATNTRVRAVFLDGDGQVSLDQLLCFALEPHVVVESSPGHFQAYWLVDGLAREQFEGVQRRIAKTFGDADSIIDLWARIQGMGLVLLLNGNEIAAMTPSEVIRTRTGGRQTYRRKPADPLHPAERCLVWELPYA